MKILITGQSGTGKSTILDELRKRGYKTINTDDYPKITKLIDTVTGMPVSWPEGYVDWSRHAWNWQQEELEKLLNTDETLFIGAVTSNQQDFYHLFGKIFVLVVSDKELYKRRTERTGHFYNKNLRNIRESVSRNKHNTEQFTSKGAIPIYNERPVEEVVDEILKIASI